MQVIKRNQRPQSVDFGKVSARIKALSRDLSIDPIQIAQKVVSRIYNNVTTTELDELAAQLCAYQTTENLDYGILASRIIISNNHKNTSPSFSETITNLYNTSPSSISYELYQMVIQNKDKLNSIIDPKDDFKFDYFGFKTLERSYLFRIDGKVVERIGYMLMRVSLGLHLGNLDNALKSFSYMRNKYFIHATPTLFHAGTSSPQLLSCYLLGMEDSVEGIFKTLGDCALISKWAGGIGIHISDIRSENQLINSTKGSSNGLVPMCKMYNDMARFINQSGKRPGSIAMYQEPHHPDCFKFIDIRKNHGNEEERARDLFTAMWISDLFMERVERDEIWSLMDPKKCPGLNEAWGDDYKNLYLSYENEKKYERQIKARDLWDAIVSSQVETGTPYILYKDTVNRYNNQNNLGTIRSSNLCAEIVEYSSTKEYACCTLSSIALPRFVENINGKLDINYQKLIDCVEVIVTNLNKVIDINFYPVVETERSNLKHRPIGVGVQGLADVFALLKIGFESEEARIVNKKIFETIYYASIKASNKLAENHYHKIDDFNKNIDYIITNILSLGKYKSVTSFIEQIDNLNLEEIDLQTRDIILKTKKFYLENQKILTYEDPRREYPGAYTSFSGSPLSHGKFIFQLYGKTPEKTNYDWHGLREGIKRFGVRNSLSVALMPTASTSQILGNNECFEPFTSNIYSRRTKAGDFIVINKYLMADLKKEGLWSLDIKNKIIKNNGSVAQIPEIPDSIKQLYKTVWEIKQKSLIQLAIDRSPYVCQTQSMNLFFKEPNMKTLSSALFYGWKNKLKTGCYYIRSQPKVQAQQFTVDLVNKKEEVMKCSLKNREECEACSA